MDVNLEPIGSIKTIESMFTILDFEDTIKLIQEIVKFRIQENEMKAMLKNRKNTIIMTNNYHKFSLLLFFEICTLLLIRLRVSLSILYWQTKGNQAPYRNERSTALVVNPVGLLSLNYHLFR